MKTRLATPNDCNSILELQIRYHIDTVSVNDRGFLAFKFQSPAEFLEICNETGIIVLEDDAGKVAGYNVLMNYNRACSHSLYRPVVAQFETAYPEIPISKIAVSAQYCIEEGPCRGGAGVRLLFQKQKEICIKSGIQYTLGEVHSQNRISNVTVVRMLKYTKFGEYQAPSGLWYVYYKKEF